MCLKACLLYFVLLIKDIYQSEQMHIIKCVLKYFTLSQFGVPYTKSETTTSVIKSSSSNLNQLSKPHKIYLFLLFTLISIIVAHDMLERFNNDNFLHREECRFDLKNLILQTNYSSLQKRCHYLWIDTKFHQRPAKIL